MITAIVVAWWLIVGGVITCLCNEGLSERDREQSTAVRAAGYSMFIVVAAPVIVLAFAYALVEKAVSK